MTGTVAGVSAHLSRPTKRVGAFVVRVSLLSKSQAVGLYTALPPPPPGGWKQPMFGYLAGLVRSTAEGETRGLDRGGGRGTIVMADDLDIDLSRQGADVVMRLDWTANGAKMSWEGRVASPRERLDSLGLACLNGGFALTNIKVRPGN